MFETIYMVIVIVVLVACMIGMGINVLRLIQLIAFATWLSNWMEEAGRRAVTELDMSHLNLDIDATFDRLEKLNPWSRNFESCIVMLAKYDETL